MLFLLLYFLWQDCFCFFIGIFFTLILLDLLSRDLLDLFILHESLAEFENWIHLVINFSLFDIHCVGFVFFVLGVRKGLVEERASALVSWFVNLSDVKTVKHVLGFRNLQFAETANEAFSSFIAVV